MISFVLSYLRLGLAANYEDWQGFWGGVETLTRDRVRVGGERKDKLEEELISA